MLIRHLQKLGRRASVSVEFALISTFFLLPLFAASADLIKMVAAQSQLNTALQALYYFAWTNPSAAANNTDIDNIVALINATSFHQINTPPTSAATTSTTTICLTPPSTYTASPCSAGQTPQTQTFVTYKITSSAFLPFPIPLHLGSQFSLSASGQIQIQ
jgi:Flp pilus assembly protein TadG